MAVDNGLYDHLIEADYNFHSCIIKGSGNTLFSDIYEVLRAFMYEEIKTTYKNMPNLTSIIEEHQEFIDAIQSGEISQVQTILVKHINVIKSKLKKALNR